MDKEAQEKINGILHQYIIRNLYGTITISEDWITNLIIKSLNELGYRKLPEDKPPLLSDEGISTCWNAVMGANPLYKSIEEAIAQAQREADIKWYESK